MAQNEAPATPAPGAAPAAAAGAPAPKSSGSKLIFVVLGVSVINLGGTGFVAMRSMNPVVIQAAAPAPPLDHLEVGPVAPLDAFVVNLNEPGSTRYLKASVELELDTAKAAEDVIKRKGMLRDELLRYLSSLTVEDTLGENGKTKIQSEMLARVEKVLGTGKARKLFFSEFVVQ